jgi:hypothetical protein
VKGAAQLIALNPTLSQVGAKMRAACVDCVNAALFISEEGDAPV